MPRRRCPCRQCPAAGALAAGCCLPTIKALLSTIAGPMRVLLLNGPNLNLLGLREPGLYGSSTLEAIEADLRERASAQGLELEVFQSNHEGALIDRIHAARGVVDGILINAGAYTHTSIALRDALLGVGIPYVELHLSNVHAREPFRHHSLLADRALGVICGFGPASYALALEGLVGRLRASGGGS